MNSDGTSHLSLWDLRTKSGLTQEEVAARLAEETGTLTRSHVSIHHLERRGIEKSSVQRALAKIYGVTLDEIDAASTVTKNNYNK